LREIAKMPEDRVAEEKIAVGSDAKAIADSGEEMVVDSGGKIIVDYKEI